VTHERPIRLLLLASALLLPLTGSASAQSDEDEAESPPATSDPVSEKQGLGPMFELEQNVRKIYATFFKRNRNEQTRQRGWEELAAYAHDERVYPLLIDLFEREPTASRNELLDFFTESAGPQAQTLLAWVAVFETDDIEHRDYASAMLAGLIGSEGEPDNGAQTVMAMGLKSGNDEHIEAAARLVRTYNLLRAVPLLAQAQLQPRSSGRDVRTGALAQIVVGTQQAFVADLTPVVATSAVAFQPTIGVVSSGTVLRVMDAVVYEYRTNVHKILVDMTSAATGQRTGRLGYDADAWRDWYARELEPQLDAADAERGTG
jgi:hypothetical protein